MSEKYFRTPGHIFFLLLVVLTGQQICFAQKPRIRFQHITSHEGLSNNTVESILQDNRGFMWFGTRDGLNRYDGINVAVFRNSLQDKSSISQNLINDIYQDRSGALWIATSEALDLFIPETETFQHFSPDKSVTAVNDIAEDRTGQLWVGTNKGLYRFDRKKKSFSRFTNSNFGTVNKVLADSKGNLWLGTESGLYRIKQDQSVKHFRAQTGNPLSLQSPIIHEVFEDSRGRIWVGMSEGGLSLFNPGSETFKTFKADPGYAANPEHTNSLPHSDIRSVVEGEPGVLWVGTENGGLCVFDTDKNLFVTYKPSNTDAGSLSHDSLHSLYKDKEGNIWIGTWAGGVNFFSPSLLKFQLFNKFPGATFPGVESIYKDQTGIIWLGVVGTGLHSFDPKSQRFSYYPNPNINKFEVGVYSISALNEDILALAIRRGGMAFFDKRKKTFTHYLPVAGKNSISGHQLNTVLVDRSKNVWTGGWNTGVSRFNTASKTFINFINKPGNPASLGNDLVYTIYEDKAGRIWIGTDGGGLDLYDPKINGFRHYTHNKEQVSSISHNTVISILEDTKGRFWIGTSNGLNLMDRKAGTFRVFTQKNGLPNEVIKSIIEDDYGNLWLGTNKGLCSFNPTTLKTVSFGVKDGLQGNEFLMNAAAKDNSGNLYFSGYKGLNIFHPKKLRYNKSVPPVILTDFLIANKRVPINESGSPLKKHISQTKEITLSYDHSAFSFDYAALNYVSPERNQYAFKMEGFEDAWNYVGSKHTATYTNLDPGTYTFRVIASNNDGIWNNKGTSLKIRILPPWWETWWFRLLAFLFLVGGTYKYLSYRREQELKELEEKRREEMQQVQLQFFTNISHEFRTPLSLILGPLEKLVTEDTSERFKHNYKVMFKNANRLMNLINELMDFRKIESGALRLKVTEGNLSSFIEEITEDFRNSAVERNITYNVDLGETKDAWFDRQVLEKIALNLINNSFKYTSDGGSIEVQVFSDLTDYPTYENTLILKSDFNAKSYIYLRVRDTGIGISKESIEHLFQRYYRIADAHLGSGVGLAFVKSLTFLHKGKIFVSSERLKGTEIIIALPADQNDYRPEELWQEINVNHDVKLESLHYVSEEETFNHSDNLPLLEKKNTAQKHLLIVDDNEEIRNFLKESLAEDYEVTEASNGLEGIEQAKEVLPDLIISDVMMPDMNGIEFCRRVKEDIEISHIPFMMLTAKNTLESELEGVSSGADYYFTKPVSIQLLLLTIKNIFTQRQKIKDHFSQDHHAEVRDLVHSAKDKEFMDSLLNTIESQLINPDLDIEYLCREIGMSRTKLYQKIKSITGQSIGEFVRTIRLRKAVEIMTHEDVPLTEVIYRVGIQTQSYFSKAFKKEFGKTPSQFLSEIRRH